MDDEIYTLAYFHKYSFTSCKKVKKIVIMKISRSLKKTLIIKKIVMIRKIFSNEVNSAVVLMWALRQFFFFFFHEKISHKKVQKAQNTNERLSLRCFLCA